MKQGYTSIIRVSNTKTSCLAGSRDIPCAWLSLICFFKHNHKLTPRSSVLLDSPSLGQESSLLYVPNRLRPAIWLGDTDSESAVVWLCDGRTGGVSHEVSSLPCISIYEGNWSYCDYFIWCVSGTLVILTCFVMCGCVYVWVFWQLGGCLVICVLIFTAFNIVCEMSTRCISWG
jgi:hypothetical protein